jgi:hypothetical protein
MILCHVDFVSCRSVFSLSAGLALRMSLLDEHVLQPRNREPYLRQVSGDFDTSFQFSVGNNMRFTNCL